MPALAVACMFGSIGPESTAQPWKEVNASAVSSSFDLSRLPHARWKDDGRGYPRREKKSIPEFYPLFPT